MCSKQVFKHMLSVLLLLTLLLSISIPPPSVDAAGPRRMENLGRGVVAVRDGSKVFISWRLLALDPANIGFNVYRKTNNGSAVKLNSSVLTGGTNFQDTTADLTKNNSYYVRPVISGTEQSASASFLLKANSPTGPYLTVPLQNGGEIRNVWVGDFDGDGEYDFLLDRSKTTPQTLEAYKRDGTLLWTISLGPNSANQNNISPGSATIDVGMWDGATVYDLNGDGKAEVILKIANGVTFGDGTTWTHSSDTKQWLAIIDGMTGTLLKYKELPTDYSSAGPLAVQLGIGYLNGSTPSIIVFAKNRNADKSFNCLVAAYNWNGGNLNFQWKWLRNVSAPDGHQMRIVDLDGDGTDEIAHIGFVLNSNGTLRYSLASSNVVHGDRFYIGKLDPNRSGLQGYGIQQDNPYGLLEYYYDATTGAMIWQHSTTPPAGDVGRGNVGDLDPNHSGFEVWSFSGIYNAKTNTQIATDSQAPWPALRLWWDGDLLSESINDGKIEKWKYDTKSLTRLVSTWNFENATRNDRKDPVFYGDILGDWREEVVMANSSYNKLIIFTTNIPTTTRLYTLAQNPAYRNSMTIKGYVQSHLTDYYLGHGMSTPPTPNIYLAP